MSGGADGIRTHDLMNAIHALSQLSYGPKRNERSSLVQRFGMSNIRRGQSGGADGIRTHDLMSAIHALSRAELRPHRKQAI